MVITAAAVTQISSQYRYFIVTRTTLAIERSLLSGFVFGCFPLCERFRKFRSEFKWKGSFPFLLTGIFGITIGIGPHISVEIFRPIFDKPVFLP